VATNHVNLNSVVSRYVVNCYKANRLVL